MKRFGIMALGALWMGVLVLALAGCATGPRGIEVRTVEVVKPVPVACVTRDQIPAEPATIESQHGRGWQAAVSSTQAADLLAASVLEVRGALREALALLGGCAGSDPE